MSESRNYMKEDAKPGEQRQQAVHSEPVTQQESRPAKIHREPKSRRNKYQRVRDQVRSELKRMWKREPVAVIGVVVAGVVAIATLGQWRATVATQQSSQRAWVWETGFTLAEEPTAQSPNIKITIQVTNTGSTPAVDIRHGFKTFVVGPNESYVWPRSTTQSAVIFPNPPRLTMDALGMVALDKINHYISDQRYSIVLLSRITYRDVFGSLHYTDTCMFHMHGKPLQEFLVCGEGNGVDQSWLSPLWVWLYRYVSDHSQQNLNGE